MSLLGISISISIGYITIQMPYKPVKVKKPSQNPEESMCVKMKQIFQPWLPAPSWEISEDFRLEPRDIGFGTGRDLSGV